MNNERSKSRKPKKRWRRILLIILLSVILAVSYTGYRAWAFLQGLNDGLDLELIDKPADNETINLLIMGVDHLPGRSDTLIFVSYNPNTEKVLAMSIPRDTKTFVPGYWKSSGKPYGLQKINAAHSFGGIPLAVDTVKRFLGVDIHYYARLDYSALHKLVDAVGGVPVDIKFRMKYDDNAGNLHIDFKPGKVTLDGQKAEEFLRWRKNTDGTGDGLGDLGRVQRQQEFLKSALNQFLKVSNLMNLGKMEEIVSDSIDTNMTASFMIKMLKDVVWGFDFDNDLTFTTVPGEFSEGGASYWIVNDENRAKLGTMLQNHLAPDIKETVNVRVLNGTSKTGLASKVAENLNKYPHVKATAGDYKTKDVTVTEVISYTEDTIAKYVAGMVDGEYNIYRGTDENTTDDIVIIIGEDFKTK
ncbi:LCP family protein [Clostridium sp. 'deep sea']|uniref:LCP family protein n=1 Tax=Clostridium sp. 'deep sea' TaxID=2779445 RepID=UPI0018967A15|nr:LCP family protein [Clostridium sp. 'deep sea']QOR36322.1 LCP family protein [Clostridium sp. 'deep sea']